MKTRFLMAGMLALALAGSALAADINGKWKGTIQGGGMGGDGIEQTYTFKVDGAKVTGTMTDQMITDGKITDGTLNGDDLSFTVSGSGQMGDMKLQFKGKVTGPDEIKLSLSFGGMGDGGGPGGPGGGGMEITVKRTK
jgi:opacity protein-like surface antigen